MSDPAVSIIVPAYNAERTIGPMIDSVLAQTFADWELIIIDDGSTDGTAAVVHGYADPRLRYHFQDNAERSAARNNGLARARGAFITFLDSDDLFLPGKLALQVAALTADPALGLVAGGNRYIDDAGAVLSFSHPWELTPRLDLDAFLAGCPIWLPHTLVRRDWVDRVGGFDSAVEPTEDYDWLLRLAHLGCPMAWTPQLVWAYRLHAHNSIRNADKVNRGHFAVMAKYFGRTDLPPAVRARRDAVLGRQHLSAALRAADTGDAAGARDHLTAFAASPLWSTRPPRDWARELGRTVTNPMWQSDPAALIDRLWDALPPAAAALQSHHAVARAQVARELFFRAWHADDAPALRRTFGAVLARDARLIDRGMLAILARRGLR